MPKAKSQKPKVKRESSGFTLIEFVVYTALTAIIMMFLFELLFGIITDQARSQAREAVMDNATRAMATIDTEVRHAERVYTELSDFSGSDDHLSLVTDKDLSGGENWTYVELYRNAENRLCMKSEREGVRCITSEEVEVTELDFERIFLDPANSATTTAGIKTTVTVEFSDPLERAPFTLDSFSRLRSF